MLHRHHLVYRLHHYYKHILYGIFCFSRVVILFTLAPAALPISYSSTAPIMLRRPATQITLTPDDIAAYESARLARQMDADQESESSSPEEGTFSLPWSLLGVGPDESRSHQPTYRAGSERRAEAAAEREGARGPLQHRLWGAAGPRSKHRGGELADEDAGREDGAGIVRAQTGKCTAKSHESSIFRLCAESWNLQPWKHLRRFKNRVLQAEDA